MGVFVLLCFTLHGFTATAMINLHIWINYYMVLNVLYIERVIYHLLVILQLYIETNFNQLTQQANLQDIPNSLTTV